MPSGLTIVTLPEYFLAGLIPPRRRRLWCQRSSFFLPPGSEDQSFRGIIFLGITIGEADRAGASIQGLTPVARMRTPSPGAWRRPPAQEPAKAAKSCHVVTPIENLGSRSKRFFDLEPRFHGISTVGQILWNFCHYHGGWDTFFKIVCCPKI